MRSLSALVVMSALCFGRPAQSWDKHQVLTRAALANETTLDRLVEVVPIERYLKSTFGERCTWAHARDTVFDGVGRDFQLVYQSQVPYSFEAEWEKGNNILTLRPEAGSSETDPQRLGSRVSAREVIATYSDEPDWKMDDDVARLLSANLVAEANSGTATRALRHFWTPNEEFMGVNLGKGQETDHRMQLYYLLAMLAFENGHDYWGYRLLGNAVHYLQDMTQPFHVQLIINTDMLDVPVALHRLMCDVDRDLTARYPQSGPARCKLEETISKSIIESGWYVGTYHGLFEDFALALLEANAFLARDVVAEDSTEFQPLRWRGEGSALLDVKSVIRQAQMQTVEYAPKTGEMVLAAFGSGYVRNRQRCELALTQMGQSRSREYLMGASYYLVDPSSVSESQFRNRAALVKLTQALQRVGATWARQFVREALAPRTDAAKAELQKLRQRLTMRCSSSSHEAARDDAAPSRPKGAVDEARAPVIQPPGDVGARTLLFSPSQLDRVGEERHRRRRHPR